MLQELSVHADTQAEMAQEWSNLEQKLHAEPGVVGLGVRLVTLSSSSAEHLLDGIGVAMSAGGTQVTRDAALQRLKAVVTMHLSNQLSLVYVAAKAEAALDRIMDRHTVCSSNAMPTCSCLPRERFALSKAPIVAISD